MKTIGLLGGMSFESTIPYYKIINEEINKALGGLHSAKIILYSVDFAEIEECQKTDNWQKSAQILSGAAKNLEDAGADCIVLCTNTMHKVADEIQNAIDIPLLHIAQTCAEELKKNSIKKAALAGTKYTMQQDFYKKELAKNGIEVLIPEDNDIEIINNIIFQELCKGKFLKESKKEFIRIINSLVENGAEGIIFGCTEIGLLLNQDDLSIKVFDTTAIHAKKAAEFALQK
ncbi:TPA: aspartate/glutamate racemase family protein [Candidatus Galligastranaerophilus faecipullorum]|nr:aspartate/glutamate racemase family protein [Candidatus Galligastranaerophilus faecipullorum]